MTGVRSGGLPHAVVREALTPPIDHWTTAARPTPADSEHARDGLSLDMTTFGRSCRESVPADDHVPDLCRLGHTGSPVGAARLAELMHATHG